ncbi:uncharacterized protein LOC129760442 [Uranotaenia lowii]|uniref:uncharacterized protein LOC129760442 n=1 Tax=Uranotaenia lowii TaxID=190385 RepID=UPI00247AD19F|nr:uncharacterized protein LOC129760442 [Uranotaenia lowii]XP_055614057.1 uncharacterized protein LOC129760442 [Uranotaenia lowii]
MMGLQTATSSSNKRKFEDSSVSGDEDNAPQQQQQQQQKTEDHLPNQEQDGPSECKNPRLELMEEQKEQNVEMTDSSTRSTSSSSNNDTNHTTESTSTGSIMSINSSITKPIVASPLIAGTPTTVPVNSPLLLPPVSSPVEDSIAKLEAVAVPGETNWSCESLTDPISKLQAVAVPGEAWGSDSTRSTLATTLLAADDLDDDDDDFEDDFDDDETILPSYSPIRYPCSPNRGGYLPAYPKPGYFPEPYQNCSRTGSGNNGAQQYASRGYGWSQHGYYSPPYEAPPSQQTIRCAENGKSYFELGSANYTNIQQFGGAQGRHLKRCCDGRNMSCNNKQCYKERRLKMMNLSMFKLARFRQASDQSLYRSVLICNTLKSIEREIDNENKEFNHHHLHQQHHPHPHYSAPPHHHLQHVHQSQQQNEYNNGPLYNNNRLGSDKQTSQPQAPKFSDINNSGSPSYNRLQSGSNASSNTSSQPLSSYGTSTASECTADQQESQTITTQLSSYDQQSHHLDGSLATVTTASPTTVVTSTINSSHHPLKEPQSGRATPFPLVSSSIANSTNSSSNTSNGVYHDSDSGFGDDDCTRPINWGSVLSLSSQSALDPLNNNDLFVTSPSVAVSVANDNSHSLLAVANNDNCDSSTSNLGLSTASVPGSDATGTIVVAGSNGSVNSDSSSESNLHHHHHHHEHSQNPASSSTNTSSTTTLTSLTTLTSNNHCDLNLTTLTTSPTPLLSSCASALQYHSSTNGSSWDLAYLDMDLGTTHELYDMFPNCYKITSFNSDVEMLGLKSSMLEPGKVVCDNDMDSFTTHIMVGS